MIRKATQQDLAFIYGLYMHPQINEFLLYEQMPLHEFEPIYQELLAKEALFIYFDKQQDIGMCKLLPLTHRTSHIIYLGGVGIHPDFAGKGHGMKMMQEIIDYAKENNFKRIELSTYTSNEKAIGLYEKAGFMKEGVLRKFAYLKSRNVYIDEVLMSYIDDIDEK